MVYGMDGAMERKCSSRSSKYTYIHAIIVYAEILHSQIATFFPFPIPIQQWMPQIQNDAKCK
jgi:hypothetical protein